MYGGGGLLGRGVLLLGSGELYCGGGGRAEAIYLSVILQKQRASAKHAANEKTRRRGTRRMNDRRARARVCWFWRLGLSVLVFYFILSAIGGRNLFSLHGTHTVVAMILSIAGSEPRWIKSTS